MEGGLIVFYGNSVLGNGKLTSTGASGYYNGDGGWNVSFSGGAGGGAILGYCSSTAESLTLTVNGGANGNPNGYGYSGIGGSGYSGIHTLITGDSIKI